jgi:hypothetical protein
MIATSFVNNQYPAYATLILKWPNKTEQILNLESWQVEFRPKMWDYPSPTGMFVSQRPVGVDVHVNGTIINEIKDAQIRYLTEKKFSQKRIDIVNIDPSLQWQPREKIT